MNKNDLYDTLFKKYRKRKITVSSSEIKNLINRFYFAAYFLLSAIPKTQI